MKTHHIIYAITIATLIFSGCTTKEMITNPTRLEFRETYENSEIIGYLIKADELLRKTLTAGNEKVNPLLSILAIRTDAKGEPLSSCVVGLVKEADTSMVDRYMQIPVVKALFPPDLRLIWSHNPYKSDSSESSYELHATKVTLQGSASLDGSVITSASVSKISSGTELKISMSPEGKARWAKITRENIGKCIAVVVDGQVWSYPRVMDEITGGNTEISGDFSEEEAGALVKVLNSGH